VESILLSRGESVSDDGSASADLQQQLNVLQAENETLKEKLETHIPEATLMQEQKNTVYREQQYQTRIEELTEHIEQLSTTSDEYTISNEKYDQLALSKNELAATNQQLQLQVDELKEQLYQRSEYDEESALRTLREIYEGRSDEELVLAALCCGVKNERAFLRWLLGDCFKG